MAPRKVKKKTVVTTKPKAKAKAMTKSDYQKEVKRLERMVSKLQQPKVGKKKK